MVASRLKVLFADDHRGILKSVSRMLAAEFDVVATVADGRDVLPLSRLLAPDIVLLDITMPGRDGFETAEELKRSGSPAKIVFLTMHEEHQYLRAAMRCGADGYVLKTRVPSDLLPALRHVMAGRQFLPSLIPVVSAGGSSHTVQFHSNDGVWIDEVADVVSSALHLDDLVAVVLREANRRAVARRLSHRGWDLSEVERQGKYLSFDAADSVTRIVRDGRPEVTAVREIMASLERARLASARRRVILIGEIAGCLCADGNPEAALQLEQIWNDLTRSMPFVTVCAYPVDCFRGEAATTQRMDICDQHTVVSHAHLA